MSADTTARWRARSVPPPPRPPRRTPKFVPRYRSRTDRIRARDRVHARLLANPLRWLFGGTLWGAFILGEYLRTFGPAFRWYPNRGVQALLAFVFVTPVVAGAAFARTASIRIVCGSVLLCLALAHLYWGVMPVVGLASLSTSIALLAMAGRRGEDE